MTPLRYLLAIVSSAVLILCLLPGRVQAQRKTENVILVTLDGLRWQETFLGADNRLMNKGAGVRDVEGLKKRFWAESESERF